MQPTFRITVYRVDGVTETRVASENVQSVQDAQDASCRLVSALTTAYQEAQTLVQEQDAGQSATELPSRLA